MERYVVALLSTLFLSGLHPTVSPDDAQVTAILDKAMEAIGGEDKLRTLEAATWKGKGQIMLGDGKEHEFTSQTTIHGFDRFRSELEVRFSDATTLKMLTILNGAKVWYTVGDLSLYPDAGAARLHRTLDLTMIPLALARCKRLGFKVEAAGEEQIGGQPAVVLKVKYPDGKDIAIAFDKVSGLPVKAVGTVFNVPGQEVTQETTYGAYRGFGGIQIATRLEIKINGKPSRKQELTEFKVLDRVDPATFSVPDEAAGPDRAARTVPGPEVDRLLPAATGYVLFAIGSDQPDGIARGDIVAVQLPTLKNTIVRPTTPPNRIDMPTIHALSGPDAEGRIAYVEDHFFVADEKTRRHLLKSIRLDGTNDTELFTRPGDAIWAMNGEIGDDLALAPVGGRVAFLSGLAHAQVPSATCLLMVGTVEIWDVDRKTRTTSFPALDGGLAWLPDGKRLAYVKLVDPRAAALADLLRDSFGKSFKGWEQVPAVFLRDVEAQTESLLHIGWHPIVSCDGQSALVSDVENSWKHVDVTTGKSITATWPGLWSPIASPSRDIVLSLCVPTHGTKVRHTAHNSPLVGPKEMLSLKLARVNANEFQTVVPNVDPRTRVSFGQVRRDR
jgi:hypothetical protein